MRPACQQLLQQVPHACTAITLFGSVSQSQYALCVNRCYADGQRADSASDRRIQGIHEFCHLVHLDWELCLTECNFFSLCWQCLNPSLQSDQTSKSVQQCK